MSLAEAALPAGAPRRWRERRIDLLRGMVLLAIFITHVPGAVAAHMTPHNFGFSDSAEIFVLLAGISAMLANDRLFTRDGARAGLVRMARRCGSIHAVHLLLIAAFSVIGLVSGDPECLGFACGQSSRLPGTGGLAVLSPWYQPGWLNVMPLYVVLMALFPLLWAGLRRNAWLTFLASGLVWVFARGQHGLHFTNSFDGEPWHFNPFAWQLLFLSGMGLALRLRAPQSAEGPAGLPYHPWLRRACWAVLGIGLVQMTNWSALGMPDLAPFSFLPSKANLSPLRLLHALSLIYIVLTSDRFARLLRWRPWLAVETCGRHSLAIFAAGVILSRIGRTCLSAWGTGWPVQLVVTFGGFATLIGIAELLERGRTKAKAAAPADGLPVFRASEARLA